MALMTRRAVLAVGGTLTAGAAARKPYAAELPDLAEVLVPVNPPQTPPDGVFVDADGAEHTLASFLGHGMVINFWAPGASLVSRKFPRWPCWRGHWHRMTLRYCRCPPIAAGRASLSAWFKDAQRVRPAGSA